MGEEVRIKKCNLNKGFCGYKALFLGLLYNNHQILLEHNINYVEDMYNLINDIILEPTKNTFELFTFFYTS